MIIPRAVLVPYVNAAETPDFPVRVFAPDEREGDYLSRVAERLMTGDGSRATRLAEALSVERGPESIRRSRGEKALEWLARYCVVARMSLAGALYVREDGEPEKAEPLLALADDLAWLVGCVAAGRAAQG